LLLAVALVVVAMAVAVAVAVSVLMSLGNFQVVALPLKLLLSFLQIHFIQLQSGLVEPQHYQAEAR
jgi:hypothetical protein